MKWTTPDQKEAEVATSVPTDQKDVEVATTKPTASDSAKVTSKSGSKWQWVGMILLLVICVALGSALLVTFMRNNEIQSSLIKEVLDLKDKDGKEMTEEIVKDGAVTTYTVHGQDGTMNVIIDTKKNLGVVALDATPDRESQCLVYILTNSGSNPTTTATDPSPESKGLERNVTKSDGSVKMTLERSSGALEDVSFLPQAAQDLCAGRDVFWATLTVGESSEADKTEELHRREKRAVYYFRYRYSFYRGGVRYDVYYCVRVR